MDELSIEPSTCGDVRDEGVRLGAAAAELGLPLRMIGGVAFYVRCPSARLPPLTRTYGDVDFIGLSGSRARITDFFETEGYVQDRMFNALHGAQRLNFTDPARGRPIDVVLDQFTMCHTIDFRDRLLLEPMTVPLTDLLLSKLQVIELNRKDVQDLLALLIDHELGEEPGEAIDRARLRDLLGADWGFEHTARLNLGRVADQASRYSLGDDLVERVRSRVDAITALLDRSPKSLRWKLRATIGERVQWYEVPEEGRR